MSDWLIGLIYTFGVLHAVPAWYFGKAAGIEYARKTIYNDWASEESIEQYEAEILAERPKSCPTRIMDGRNELRCWLAAGHEGDCK